MQPLADLIRPKNLEQIAGQGHILGENKPLYNIIKSGKIPNMIFYGSSGVGKTTVARIIADNSDMLLYKLNGTQASVADIKDIVSKTKGYYGYNGILLYLDEIQYLNKKQQQSLLEYIENGKITLIASTTENPYFYVYGAILSRSTVFEFKPVSQGEIIPVINRAFDVCAEQNGKKITLEKGVAELIAQGCGGDVRKSINTVELCVLSAENLENNNINISLENAKLLTQKSSSNYDREGDNHYDLMSALQKSIRGSDENAAIHYAARLIECGDIISLSRRLLVIASEDIGLAHPQAICVVKACVDSAMQLGLPEAKIPLAQAVIFLATAPKSNSAYNAINSALDDIKKGGNFGFPRNLQNKHCDGEGATQKGQNYLYPHNYPNHYVKQQYMPDQLQGRVYYEYGNNRVEQAAKAYWDNIKK